MNSVALDAYHDRDRGSFLPIDYQDPDDCSGVSSACLAYEGDSLTSCFQVLRLESLVCRPTVPRSYRHSGNLFIRREIVLWKNVIHLDYLPIAIDVSPLAGNASPQFSFDSFAMEGTVKTSNLILKRPTKTVGGMLPVELISDTPESPS